MRTLDQLKAGKLKGTKKLKLSCGLDFFPSEILDLADSLEVLDMTGNNLSQLPAAFGLLKNLKIAFFSSNNFTELPPVLSQCPQLDIVGFKANKISHFPEEALPNDLRWLILTDNHIESIPKSIGKCKKLQKVMLAGNKLKSLPDEMAKCINIELLRISANQFETVPSWLKDLPRLSWLAFAGNPCSHSSTSHSLPEILWEELAIDKQLGEGASGVISKARWKSKNSYSKDIAVKVFKGNVTSDGLPHDEMKATIGAGFHPNIVTVLGKIADHPDNREGLVFELIPPTYKNLAGPPDFKTCTRDTFPDNPIFSILDVVTIASGIASAATHLHSKGITHGDLYAHNILVNEKSEPLFGDFGAATFYKRNQENNFYELIEVRAFGCLLEDLLNHINPKGLEDELFETLLLLKESCINNEILSRPDFGSISTQLDRLKSSLNSR